MKQIIRQIQALEDKDAYNIYTEMKIVVLE